MTSQWPSGGSLSEAVERLATRVEAIDATLRAQASEAEALSPLIERAVARIGEIREAQLGLGPQVDVLTAAVETLRVQQGQSAQELQDVQSRLDKKTSEGDAPEPTLARLDGLTRQLEAIVQDQQSSSHRVDTRLEGVERRVEDLDGRHSDWLPTALSRLDGLEARLEAVAQTQTAAEPSGLQELEERVEAISRIIRLIVERSKLVAEDDAGREQMQNSVRARRGSGRGGRSQ